MFRGSFSHNEMSIKKATNKPTKITMNNDKQHHEESELKTNVSTGC